jgi:hypothetical protein
MPKKPGNGDEGEAGATGNLFLTDRKMENGESSNAK